MKPVFILFLIICSYVSQAQKLTTFILLRHAEKLSDGSKNPGLTTEGKKRAESLVALLKNTPIQAIYSTKFIRTRETVLPFAKANGLAINDYDTSDNNWINAVLKDNQGGTVLICGHSNTIPQMANCLTGTKKFKNFADDDFSNLLIITVSEIGCASSTTWLNY